MSTHESMLGLILSMCWLVLPCRGHILTLEDHNNLEGEKFCSPDAKGGNLEKLCTKTAEIDLIEGYSSISREGYCSQKEISLYSDITYTKESTDEYLLSCEYNKERVEMRDGVQYHSIIQLQKKVLGRGIGKNDVMEYTVDAKGVAHPVANRKGFLRGILSPVITLEEHKNLEGDDFCTTLANGDGFEKLCKKIAKINKIAGYDSITRNDSCNDKTISLHSESTGNVEKTVEKLLDCEYNREDEVAGNIMPLNKVALGRGERKQDVMEYRVGNDEVAYPLANREGLLAQVSPVITLEEHNDRKGENFCPMHVYTAYFRQLCNKIARLNEIIEYNTIIRKMECSNTLISLYSDSEDKMKVTEEDLLICKYELTKWKLQNGSAVSSTSTVGIRALGRGKSEKDIMEYELDTDGVAHPLANRVGLLTEVSVVITLEEHNNRKGEDFCSTRVNTGYFRLLCNEIAKIDEITAYDTITGEIKCRETTIGLYPQAEVSGPKTEENLLRCEYKKTDPALFNEGKFLTTMAERALGRGKGDNDVMEYGIDKNGVAHPLANLKDLLIQLPPAITLEELNNRQGGAPNTSAAGWRRNEILLGWSFSIYGVPVLVLPLYYFSEIICTKDTDKNDLNKFCEMAAKIDEITGYSKITSYCGKYDISLLVHLKISGKVESTKEDLLYCEYNGVGKRRVFGRGKGKKDVIEYEVDLDGVAHILINREGFLTEIENRKIEKMV